MAAHLEGTDDSNDGKRGPLFRNLALDEVDPDVTEIESLCMECERNVCVNLYSSLCYPSHVICMLGNNEALIDQDTLVQGSCCGVFLLHPLWLFK